MTKIYEVFKTNIIDVNGIKTPNFDNSVGFGCEISNGLFIVRVVDASPEKIEELKTKYEYVGLETKEFPDYVDAVHK